MALKEDYERIGQFLFKFRSFVPLILFPFYLSVIYFQRKNFGDFSSEYLWLTLCFFISSIGLFIRSLAVGYAAPNTSGRNVKAQVADSINKTGMYSIVRHPLYLGNSFIWLGIAMRLKIWWVVVIVMTYYWLYYEKIIFTEEEYLRKKFGFEYEEWANRVPLIFPKFSNWIKPSSKFNLKKIVRQENDGVYALVVNLFFIELSVDFFSDYMIHISLFWIIFFSITTILYIGVKLLKKKTCILKGCLFN